MPVAAASRLSKPGKRAQFPDSTNPCEVPCPRPKRDTFQGTNARDRLNAQQCPERYYRVEVAIGLHYRSKMPLVYKSRTNRHSVPVRNALDLLLNFINDIPSDFPLALHLHHAHRPTRLHQQISLNTPFAAFGCGSAVRSRRQHMRGSQAKRNNKVTDVVQDEILKRQPHDRIPAVETVKGTKRKGALVYGNLLRLDVFKVEPRVIVFEPVLDYSGILAVLGILAAVRCDNPSFL